jgi:D-glycero-D-manno-heptose 1,7-bisphosphate phosphatase
MTLRPAVFFDRDGTLMEDTNYCGDPALVRVFPGVPEALHEVREAGYVTVVITNQSGIGRGYFTEQQYHAVAAEFLRQTGHRIDATYFCPDVPGVPSACRKPEPGMVFAAARDLQLDLSRSWFVGDKDIDVECGRRAGTRTIQVSGDYGVVEAVRQILRTPPG